MRKRPMNGLVQSVVCTAVFAVVFGLIVTCGGNNSVAPPPPGGGGGGGGTPQSQVIARIVSTLKPSINIFPAQASTQKPVLASMALFQTGTTPASQLQQSFQANCDLTGVNAPPNVLIPLLQPVDRGVPSCASTGVQFDPQPQSNQGTPMFFAGTLSSLVATAFTQGGATVRCSDITTTAAVQDQQLVQAYYNVSTNAIVLAAGGTALSFNCVLPVPAGDSITQLAVQWGKI